MRILVDIGHPAHVHFFKNLIWEMEKKGHEFLITARDKDVAFHLLKAYGFDFVNLGKHKKGILGKMKGLVEFDLKLLKIAKKFNPDVMIGIASPYITHVSKLIGSKSVVFTDTEYAWISNKLAVPFADFVVTHKAFELDFGKKHIRYDGYQELAYLHPRYFKPDKNVLDLLGADKDEYSIIRLVSWSALHDIGHGGFNEKMLDKVIGFLEEKGKVFITSEGRIPSKYKKYILKIPPEKLHDAVYFSSMYVGEGGTMATESALMGVPSIFVSTTGKLCGVFKELESYGLLKIITTRQTGFEDLRDSLYWRKDSTKPMLKKLLREKVDVTEWSLKFITSII